MPGVGARGQNLEHLRFFSFPFFLVWNHSYLNNRFYLGLNLSVTSNLCFKCPEVVPGVKI